jgi:succinate dehydrogenase/fumarate reductase flavoprotein subunit
MIELHQSKSIFSDVLIVGGGGAGLRAAIEAKEMGADVVIVSKTRAGYGNNTMISKATFAAADGWADPEDNPDVMIRDTVMGGRFINDQKLVAAVAKGSGAQTAFLEKCGARFLKHEGKNRAIYAPGHSHARHVRAQLQSGRGITLPLRKYARDKGVRFADRVFITRLISSRDGRIAGVIGFTHDGILLPFISSCVILATGGFAHVYLRHNNAPGITGDGQALAYNIGMPLRDMEFVQFYPTASGHAWTRLLLYEDLVLDNAVIRNMEGDDIIAKYGLGISKPMTRDQVSRAIMSEILEGRGVEGGAMMDLSKVSEQTLLPYQSLLKGPNQTEVIVSPTTHFCNGGIIVNEDAESQLPGLFAAGEVCGGVHGANRIAGNALSEVFTMGEIAGKKAAVKAREIGRPEFPKKEITAEKARLESQLSRGDRPLSELLRSMKETMWQKAGIMRNKKDLEMALSQIEASAASCPEIMVNDFRDLMRLQEFQNLIVSAEMICRAALLRTESRGAHYRSDFPEEDNSRWVKNIVISKKDTEMGLREVPVSMDVISP